MMLNHFSDRVRKVIEDRGVTQKELIEYLKALALMDIARNIGYLGNGNASTQMGAIEALGAEVARIADALHNR